MKMRNMFSWIVLGLCCSIPATAQEEISIFAGSTPRDNCPVVVDVPAEVTLPAEPLHLADGDETLPAMVLRGANNVFQLAFIVNGMKPYEKRTFRIESGEAGSLYPVTVEQKSSQLDILIGGQAFTNYIFQDDTLPRPIFYPVLGPGGARMTRGYPMDPHEGESTDHKHHHSLWVSHGKVNDVDFWITDEKNGRQQHMNFANVTQGPVCGQFEEGVEWVDASGKPILFETRKITVWGMPETNRMIDFDITFIARYEDVTFGDTKEGGFISLRVAQTLNEKQPEGTQGGVITNANNLVGEKNAWGKAAAWCDYSGTVDGVNAGLTIMDHPQNIFFPTFYHVRSYGLFTANPFGLHDFYGDDKVNGSRILKKGESWNLKYRLYVHDGDVQSGRVAQVYDHYSAGPEVFWK